MSPDVAICRVTAPEEQAWIAATLNEPVLRPALRIWQYRRPGVVLGCGQRPDAEMAARTADAGADLCVRSSGGGAVLAGPWLLGVAAILPPRHPLIVTSIAQSFRWFGLSHLAWLQGLGIMAECATELRRGEALSWACFATLSHWEVEASGGKIVGLCQARRRNGVLFSAGVLIAPPPWEMFCAALGKPPAQAAELSARTANCAETPGWQVSEKGLAPSLLLNLSAVLRAAGPL